MTLKAISHFGVRSIILAAASATAALVASNQNAAADELSAIVGCAQAGSACNFAGLMPGNAAAIQQNGSFNRASVEQQAILGAYPNVTSIQQTGDYDTANVTQTGSQNVVSITQHGSHDTAIVQQNGSHLSVQITQWGNGGSVGVTQSGVGATTTTKQH